MEIQYFPNARQVPWPSTTLTDNFPPSQLLTFMTQHPTVTTRNKAHIHIYVHRVGQEVCEGYLEGRQCLMLRT